MTRATRIVVVDDDADIRETEIALLEGEGYRVASASNGKEALEILARSAEPCLVLCNMMMPEMTGSELLGALRANHRLDDVTFVLVSANRIVDKGDGAAAIMRKPVDAEALLSLVAQYCEPVATDVRLDA